MLKFRFLATCFMLLQTSVWAQTYMCPSPTNPSVHYEQKKPCGYVEEKKPTAEKPNCDGIPNATGKNRHEFLLCLGLSRCLDRDPLKDMAQAKKCAVRYLTETLAQEKEKQDKEAALQKLPEPTIGMSTFEARISRWGQPEHVRRTQMAGAEWEHWTYLYSNRELHFKNEVLVLIRR